MTQSIHYDPVFSDAALGDGEIQEMARRQISVSVVVGLGILAIAALLMVRAPLPTAEPIAAQHTIVSHVLSQD
jgi:hypothetical protein